MDEEVTMFEPAYQIQAGYRSLVGYEPVAGQFREKGGSWRKEIGRKVYRTPDEARAEAENIRVKRVASLTKQLSKLNALSHIRLV